MTTSPIAEIDTPATEAAEPEYEHLVLYDGVCGLCDRTVQWLLRADRNGRLRFAPLQGPTAAELRARLAIPDDVDAVIYVRRDAAGERFHTHSDAILRLCGVLPAIWRPLGWLRIVPRGLRDLVYRFIARHRYRWFGRFDVCRVPDPSVRERFLD